MALSMIEKLFQQAKNTTPEEIEKLCNGILDAVYNPDQSSELTVQLRQLYLVLYASQTEPSVPVQFIPRLLAAVPLTDKSRIKECLLCRRILMELIPFHSDESAPQDGSESKQTDTEPSKLLLHVLQGKQLGCLSKHLAQAVCWLTSAGVDLDMQRRAFFFLVSVSLLHSNQVSTDQLKTVSDQMSSWLMNASLCQAPVPYTFNPFKKDQNYPVTEVDGNPATNFFTVLNIGQYYTNDQLLNIYTFSMLYQWLCQACRYTRTEKSITDTTEGNPQQLDKIILRKIFDSLVGRSIDYAFRVLDQCERKPKIPTDAELQMACLVETVNILDLVCQLDESHIPRVFQEVKRMYSKLSQDPANARIIIHVLQFTVNHCTALPYDASESFKLFFHKMLTRSFSNPAVAFETVLFIRKNLEFLCYETNVLSAYFPSILKILAWNPRSFVSDFCEIIPAMLSPTTAMEIFHALLDLPCMTASLEVIDKVKVIDPTSTTSPTSVDLEPTNSVDAFKSLLFRPMFNFFTRVEGGHGDTINRLESFHAVLQDMANHPRVLVCSQIVPVLTRVWFSVILEKTHSEFVSHLLPVLMERTNLLFRIPEFQDDIKKIISEYLLLLLKKFPEVFVTQLNEVIEFLTGTRNIIGKEDFFTNLVWAVGEYFCLTSGESCAPEKICQMYECLEVLSYEVSGITASTPAAEAPFSIKVVSVLMSAIAKLASRRQDLTPRAILCLTKMAQQHQNDFLEKDTQGILINRAQELINLLKLPNFASVILGPKQQLKNQRVHRDSTSLAAVMRGTHRLIAPNT
ncbi:hypothetical protein CHS0354_005718 [Potamilus streckersoni]|uniref:AP-5 complex subunit zeta-1 n=1 Tax=Potamilus streckersoni TaxID=2493646 RepID=A0AAE0RWA9_9BIVA|nr:hypothetical protein CHS0354_005718 [Potamilus streckersoni]